MACQDIPSKVKEKLFVPLASKKEAQHLGSLSPSSGYNGCQFSGHFTFLKVPLSFLNLKGEERRKDKREKQKEEKRMGRAGDEKEMEMIGERKVEIIERKGERERIKEDKPT